MGSKLLPSPHAISRIREVATLGAATPNSRAIAAIRFGCVSACGCPGYGTSSYAVRAVPWPSMTAADFASCFNPTTKEQRNAPAQNSLFALMSYLNRTLVSNDPSAFWGLYSTSTLAKFIPTDSIASPPAPSDALADVTTTSFILITR